MDKQMMCKHCGTISIPKKKVPGYFFIELLLWCLFILPGLAYTIWRLTNKQNICPACKASNMIPLNSPIAQKILNT